MKLEDILKSIPVDKTGVQFLSECVISAKEKKRPHKHCELTIVTEAVTPMFLMGKSDKVGILVWIDKDEYLKAINAAEKADGGEL